MINLNLNMEQIFEVHEIVRPYYSEGNRFQKSNKVIPEKITENQKKKSKKNKDEVDEDQEENKTEQTGIEDLESEISLHFIEKKKKKRRFRVCCIKIKPGDGRCKKWWKFLWCCSWFARIFNRENQHTIANFDKINTKNYK